MQAYDWSFFLLRLPIRANGKTIFNCWTTQQGLENWFLRSAKFIRPDGSIRDANSSIEINDNYEWLWHGWADDVAEKGNILELSENFLKFSFGKAENVSIIFKQEAGQNILELLQDEIPVDENSQIYYHLGCTKGWIFYLTNLKSILEGGIDLRNRDIELENVITA